MAYENIGRLPDPTTDPIGPGFVSQTLIDNSPGMIHPLNNGSTISIKFAGNYWGIDVVYPNLTIAESKEVVAFLYSIQSGFSNFYIQLPNHKDPLSGAWTLGSDTLEGRGNISIGASANEIVVVNYDLMGGTWSVGDMLKFDNSNKIYMVTYVNVSAGTGTIRFSCDILEPEKVPASGFEPNDLLFRVRLKNPPKITLNADGLYDSINLNMRENIL